jgi:hypothetical protein
MELAGFVALQHRNKSTVTLNVATCKDTFGPEKTCLRDFSLRPELLDATFLRSLLLAMHPSECLL